MRYAKWCLLAAAIVLADFPVHAAPRFIAGESGVFCRSDGGSASGALCDAVNELQHVLGYSEPIEVVPQARLKPMLQSGSSWTFFLPTVAGDDDSAAVRPVIELLEEEFVVVTSAAGNQSVESPLDLKGLGRICVLRGSYAESAARNYGWTNIEPTASQEACARKLALGRNDAWLSTWNGARYSAKQAGIDPQSLVRGMAFKRAKLILVASSDVPAAEIERWRSEFRRLKDSGRLARIFKRYDIQRTRAARRLKR